MTGPASATHNATVATIDTSDIFIAGSSGNESIATKRKDKTRATESLAPVAEKPHDAIRR